MRKIELFFALADRLGGASLREKKNNDVSHTEVPLCPGGPERRRRGRELARRELGAAPLRGAPGPPGPPPRAAPRGPPRPRHMPAARLVPVAGARSRSPLASTALHNCIFRDFSHSAHLYFSRCASSRVPFAIFCDVSRLPGVFAMRLYAVARKFAKLPGLVHHGLIEFSRGN